MTDVTNLIVVKPSVSPTELKARIKETLRRNAELDARRITVEVEGSKVIHRGTVRSWAEKAVAAKEAWSAPGVSSIEHLITVEP